MMLPTPMSGGALIHNGIKRTPGNFIVPFEPRYSGIKLNLGSGNAPMEGAINLDRPEWEAPILADYSKDSCSEVHMYHFLEHLNPDDAITMLKEVERVLIPRGLAYICVPHAMCPLAYQAPDHKSYWTEEGFQDTFYSAGYDSGYGHMWDLNISWMMVAGVKWSNLCVHVQLIKDREFESVWRRDVRDQVPEREGDLCVGTA